MQMREDVFGSECVFLSSRNGREGTSIGHGTKRFFPLLGTMSSGIRVSVLSALVLSVQTNSFLEFFSTPSSWVDRK